MCVVDIDYSQGKDEEVRYKAQPVELYTSRLSLSYNKHRLDALDKVSTSYSSKLGIG